MKLLVPAGFMPVASAGGITIEICNGSTPAQMTIIIPGMAHRQGQPEQAGKEMPCAFAGLSAPSLAAADPLLLAIAIAFVIAVALRVTVPEPASTPAYLRPPLRGPPVYR